MPDMWKRTEREAADRHYAEDFNKVERMRSSPAKRAKRPADFLDGHDFTRDHCYRWLEGTIDDLGVAFAFWAALDPISFSSRPAALIEKATEGITHVDAESRGKGYKADLNTRALVHYLTVLKNFYDRPVVQKDKEQFPRLTLDEICREMENGFRLCEDLDTRMKLADKIVKWRGLDKTDARDRAMEGQDDELNEAMAEIDL